MPWTPRSSPACTASRSPSTARSWGACSPGVARGRARCCLRDAHTNAATRVWRRDAGQATVVPAPCVAPGALRARVLVDPAERRLVRAGPAVRGGRRGEALLQLCTGSRLSAADTCEGPAVPEDSDVGARVLVTVGRHALEPAIRNLEVFDHDGTPRAGPASRVRGAAPRRRRRRLARARTPSVPRRAIVQRSETARVRNAAGCSRTRRARCAGWRRWSAARRRRRLRRVRLRESEPVRFGGRSLFPSGRETKNRKRGRTRRPRRPPCASTPPPRRATAAKGRFGAARAVEAALTSAVSAKTHAGEKEGCAADAARRSNRAPCRRGLDACASPPRCVARAPRRDESSRPPKRRRRNRKRRQRCFSRFSRGIRPYDPRDVSRAHHQPVAGGAARVCAVAQMSCADARPNDKKKMIAARPEKKARRDDRSAEPSASTRTRSRTLVAPARRGRRVGRAGRRERGPPPGTPGRARGYEYRKYAARRAVPPAVERPV